MEIFSDRCCLVDNASTNCQTNTLARSIYPRSELRSPDARRGHAKKVGNFLLLMFSASLVQLGTTRSYIAVEEKFLGFVLVHVYELACTELHGSGSFEKRVDRFCDTIDSLLQLG